LLIELLVDVDLSLLQLGNSIENNEVLEVILSHILQNLELLLLEASNPRQELVSYLHIALFLPFNHIPAILLAQLNLLDQVCERQDERLPVIVQLGVLLQVSDLVCCDIFSNNRLGVVVFLSKENRVKACLLEIVRLELGIQLA